MNGVYKTNIGCSFIREMAENYCTLGKIPPWPTIHLRDNNFPPFPLWAVNICMIAWGYESWFCLISQWKPGGGTDLERGMGMCGPENPLFMPLLSFARVPFQVKESVHKMPYWENFWTNFSSQAPKLKIFSSQASRFGNFQFTSP